jgi:hypothetical protein
MLLTLQLGVSQLRRDVQDIKLTQGVDRATILNQLQIMNKNMKRLSNQPARMLTAAAGRRDENLNLLAGVVVGHVEINDPQLQVFQPCQEIYTNYGGVHPWNWRKKGGL